MQNFSILHTGLLEFKVVRKKATCTRCTVVCRRKGTEGRQGVFPQTQLYPWKTEMQLLHDIVKKKLRF